MLWLAWLVAGAGAALGWLLSFAGSMCAAPRFPARQRFVVAAISGLALALAVAATAAPDPAGWWAFGPGLLASFGLLVAIQPTTRRGSALAAATRTTVRGPDGALMFADDAHNLRLTELEVERSLAAQRAGNGPPRGAASWEAHWAEYEDGLRHWQRNPERHLAVVRAHRSADAARGDDARTQAGSPNARQ